jgi:multiple sugar transport system substrate-binding protein
VRLRSRAAENARTPRRRVVRGLAAATVLGLAVTGCTSGDGTTRGDNDPSPTPVSESTAPATPLTFGIYGPRDEVAALRGVVDNYNSLSESNDVRVRSWPDHESMVADLRAGDDVPDVFMASRDDLGWLQEQRVNQPVDELLDERGVDFGDNYSRDALLAFSEDNRLQCMPYDVSPTVIFYNKELVDFEKMIRRGLDAPDLSEGDTRWSFDQFAAAADFATRPRLHTRGVHVDPTLRSLAPFVYSGGGTLFDDEEQPTSLAFSDEDTRAALERTLVLLRNPHLTLSERQLARATPLAWFKRGRLGMMEGDRSLVPELRTVQGLEFDVQPMPTLDTSATVGDVTGLCLSGDTANSARAADFLVHAVSTPSVTRVARTGYLVPANLEVALSDDFLQVGRAPAHAGVFNSSVRTMRLQPPMDSYAPLERVVAPRLRELLSVPILDLDAITEEIDEASRKVLAPESASPSPE